MRRLALALLLAASVTAAGEKLLPRLSVADLRFEEGTSEWIEVIDFTLVLAEPRLRLRAGQSETISVTAMPRRSLGAPLEALSSDPTVFTVRRNASSEGAVLITAVAPGTATLTLQSRGGAISTTARVVVIGE